MSVDVATAVAAARRKQENPMRRVEIDKVVVNIGVGESGEKLAKAEKVLTMITGQKPLKTLAKKTIQPFGIKTVSYTHLTLPTKRIV